MTLPVFVAVIFAYLLGSIPFGLLLTKIAGLGDIRAIGSGNIGATNVLRTGNKKLAAATLLLDGAKGAVAVVVVGIFAPALAPIAALAALVGHIFPLWLRFKGGKGVATGLGVITALSWPVGIAMMAIWLLVAKIFHLSSLAALAAFALAPLLVMGIGRTDLALVILVISALVFITHAKNIRRLLNRSEPKIGTIHEPRSPSP